MTAEERSEPRSVDRVSDIGSLVAFTEAAVATAGQTGYLHPGDVMHRLFNGLRNEATTDDLVWLWEDDHGVAAWMMVAPGDGFYDLQVRPELRLADPGFERAALEFCARASHRALAARDRWKGSALADTFSDDVIRVGHLEALGYRKGNEPYTLTQRSLDDTPDIVLPDGYAIRPVAGVHEAEAVAAVHAAAFDSKWVPGAYAALMSTPAYDQERELVVVAPDGTLAGFTIVWFDATNRVGLFEPVGVHPDHQRRGLGRALLVAGMQQMVAAGMERAMVMYEGANEASGPLYRGMGFEPKWELMDWALDLEGA